MEGGGRTPGTSLESLISGFNARIADLQEIIIARSMSPASIVSDLSAVDAAVKSMEVQVQSIKNRVREETLAIPKAKSIIDASLKQQKNLQHLALQVRRHFPEKIAFSYSDPPNCLTSETLTDDLEPQSIKLEESGPPVLIKVKKGRGSPPMWFISPEELVSLSSYMRGRLTLEKVNAAVNDMATYAEATAQLVSAPRKKLPESMLEKALERRDIAMTEGIKGKHFFLESDMKGPTLKLDNTGKAILTVLRHLGRISEMRVGHHRVIILSKPQ